MATESKEREGRRGKKDKREKKLWLDAFFNPLADVHAFSSCVRLADLNGSGEGQLLVGHHKDGGRQALKVFNGTAVPDSHPLLEAPAAVCTFYADERLPRTPSVAVASGPHVFIYRGMRPFFKFTVPPLDIHEQEATVWKSFKEGTLSADEVFEELAVARDNGVRLSSRSLDMLGLSDAEERGAFAEEVKNDKLRQQTVITCMETIHKNQEERDAISCLVLGTESKQVIILEPGGNRMKAQFDLPDVPVFMAITGMLDIDYRIIVATRGGKLYTIKSGRLQRSVVEMETYPCAVARIGKSILVASTDAKLHCFHFRGNKLYTLAMPDRITNMEVISVRKSRVVTCLAVALENGDVRIYNDKQLVTTIKTDNVVTAMRFGQYGRAEHCLVLLFRSGGVMVKILSRVAGLEVAARDPGPPPEQDIKLKLPTKTTLYVEQSQRERDHATDMHRVFHRDLGKLRLDTARAYVKILTDGAGPMSYSTATSLRLTATVDGMGPFFKIRLTVQNSGKKPLLDVPVSLTYNHDLYHLPVALLHLPVLIPGLLYTHEVDVRCLNEEAGADVIRIFVLNPHSSVPIVSAIATMPISEGLMLDD
eukprot:PLAT11031.1.p1 GENE.PLAT11031.1~~PLAT11031.1.p1  ORF type:complete len:593 (-),score=328.29 PLAT11031.1:168-1946(-)